MLGTSDSQGAELASDPISDFRRAETFINQAGNLQVDGLRKYLRALCFLSAISGWSLSLDRRALPGADLHLLAPPAGRRFPFFVKCRIGAPMARAPGERREVGGRGVQQGDGCQVVTRCSKFCKKEFSKKKFSSGSGRLARFEGVSGGKVCYGGR